MSYEKCRWDGGTLLSARSLNHMETQYAEAYSMIQGHTHDSLFMKKEDADAAFYGPSKIPTKWNAATIDGLSPNALSAMGFKKGTITFWTKSLAEIPYGWHVCDGSSGTPELRGGYLVVAGGGYTPGQSGGFESVRATGSAVIQPHALTEAEIPQHNHSCSDGHGEGNAGGSAGWSSTNTVITGASYTDFAGGGQAHPHDTASVEWGHVDQSKKRVAYYWIKKVI